MELKETKTFTKWRNSLKDKRARAIIAARLFRLQEGLAGDVKPVGYGISELRIDYGKGYRIYYKKRDNTIIVLLCGGDKSTQKSDIKRAVELAQEERL